MFNYLFAIFIFVFGLLMAIFFSHKYLQELEKERTDMTTPSELSMTPSQKRYFRFTYISILSATILALIVLIYTI